MVLREVGVVFQLRDLADFGKIGIEIFRLVVDVGPMQPCGKRTDESTDQRDGTDTS